MAHVDVDRNLLFGLLALQNNLIDRADLLDAFSRWMHDRAVPLGQVLCDRGALKPDERGLLEALVAKHLERFGGDPEQSLQQLSSIGSVREDLSRIADADLHASLAHVSGARVNDDPFRTVAQPSFGDSTSAGSRFRILRPHAKGGLGEVFVARDSELNREVALKEIQDQFADDPRYRARFEFEAEITGGLEHPGIVPVYGLGHTPEGRPFYAMRFIQGDSLNAEIRRFHEVDWQRERDSGERLLALRGLLGRFIDVCNAVAYAHERGVLHRDLKPGNIMLGRYGQTLVVDWGLAKAMGRPEATPGDSPIEPPLRPASGSVLEPTQPGSALGTPAYMSPEQAAGRHDQLGPRSDVYCLGATLYHLLTGHAPYEETDVGKVYQKVLAGDLRRPRMLNPRIAQPLEAVCLKAMTHKPEDRYATVEELQADLERWLADEPVSAWHEPLRLRLRRWMRRHRTVAAAAAAILIVTVPALGVALQRERLNAQRLGAAKAVSDRRLDQTMVAIEDYYTGVSQEVLLGQKEFQDLRVRLLEKPRQFYDRLTTELESASDERGQALLARGRYSLGRLLWLLGRHEEAGQQHEAAIKLYRALVAAHPDSAKYQDYLARCYVDLGHVHKNMGDRAGSVDSFESSIRVFHRLVAGNADNTDYLHGLACAYVGLGVVQRDQGDSNAAVESCKQAITIASKLPALRAGVPQYQNLLGNTYSLLGGVQSEIGEYRGAAESLDHAIEIGLKLTSAQPNVLEYKESLIGCYTDLGNLQRDMQNLDAAARSYMQAIRLALELAELKPNVPLVRRMLAATYMDRGVALDNAGQTAVALQSYEHARKILEQLVREYPDNLEYKKLLAGVLTDIGVVDMRQGRRLQALGRFKEALIYWKEPFANNPKDPYYSRAVKDAPKTLSNRFRSNGQPESSGLTKPIPGTAAKP